MTPTPTNSKIEPARSNALAALAKSEETRAALLADTKRTEAVARKQHDLLVEGLPRLAEHVRSAVALPDQERAAIERAYLTAKQNLARASQVMALCRRQREKLARR